MYVPLPTVIGLADSHGIVLRRDAVLAGIDDNALARLVRHKVIVRMRQGAYCLFDVFTAASDAQRSRLLCRAVMQQYQDDHVSLSHGSSCLIQGGPDYALDLAHAHVTHLDGAGRRQARVVHHVGELRVGDLRKHQGMWVTVPARAVFEVTCLGGSEAGLVQANHFLHRGLTTPEEMQAVFERLGRWSGSISQHAVAMLANPKIESVGESRCQWLFWTQGLPAPEAQFEIFFPDGRLAARVDFAWPAHKLIVEFDGREKYHRFRREGESIEQMVMREKAREDAVRRLTGWTVIRLTWADLALPARTAQVIRSAFQAARRPSP